MKTPVRELKALLAETLEFRRQMNLLSSLDFGVRDNNRDPEELIESMFEKGYSLNVTCNGKMMCGWKGGVNPPLTFQDLIIACEKYENKYFSMLDHSPIGKEDGYIPEVGIGILLIAIFGEEYEEEKNPLRKR